MMPQEKKLGKSKHLVNSMVVVLSGGFSPFCVKQKGVRNGKKMVKK